ncbi:MAG: TonB-dependent receptor plug domain-containing protein [Gemmatimonadales bacterium]
MRYLTIVAALALGCSHQRAATGSAPAPVPPSPDPNVVTAADQSRAGASSLDQILAGRISGVTVKAAPGGGIVVRFAGAGSFLGSAEPLFVVDGVPVEVNHGTLNWISAHDVESIRALKGPDATIYGVRGANGVIVIKTKGSH